MRSAVSRVEPVCDSAAHADRSVEGQVRVPAIIIGGATVATPEGSRYCTLLSLVIDKVAALLVSDVGFE